MAIATPGRRAEQTNFLIMFVISFIDRLGYKKVYLRTEGEPSIRDFAARIRAKRTHETIEQVTPRHSHQSNGRVERTIQTVRKQMVTVRFALEDAYRVKLTPNHTAWGWLARHAAWLVARYLVKINNKTAYSEAFNAEYRGEIAPWGEAILFRRPRPEHRGLGRAPWGSRVGAQHLAGASGEQ